MFYTCSKIRGLPDTTLPSRSTRNSMKIWKLLNSVNYHTPGNYSLQQCTTLFVSVRRNLCAALNKDKIDKISQIAMDTSTPVVFHSLEPIICILKKDEFNNLEPVKKLLDIYDKTLLQYGNLKNSDKKFPFIVFEGLDATGKTTISRKFARKYDATLLKTPPQSVSDLRSFFDNQPLLRIPFYSLGNYIAELEIRDFLQRGPVVLDRYWHSTAVFWLAQSVQDAQTINLPPKQDDTYTWPTDLLKPDMVIVLRTTEEVRRKRIARRKVITSQEELLKSSIDFRKNIMQGYENMTNPEITFVEADGTIQEVLRIVTEKTKHLF